jgi:hypothetical protein
MKESLLRRFDSGALKRERLSGRKKFFECSASRAGIRSGPVYREEWSYDFQASAAVMMFIETDDSLIF